jgi:hypothetical protein
MPQAINWPPTPSGAMNRPRATPLQVPPFARADQVLIYKGPRRANRQNLFTFVSEKPAFAGFLRCP